MQDDFELDYDEDELQLDSGPPLEGAPPPAPAAEQEQQAQPDTVQPADAHPPEPAQEQSSDCPASLNDQAPADSAPAAAPRELLVSSGPTKDMTAAKAAHDSTKDKNGKPMAPNWSSRLSASTGDVYYRNTLTGESSWDIPPWPRADSAQPVRTDKGSDARRDQPRRADRAQPAAPPAPPAPPARKPSEPQGPAVWKLTGAAAESAARRERAEQRALSPPRGGHERGAGPRYARERSPPRGGRGPSPQPYGPGPYGRGRPRSPPRGGYEGDHYRDGPPRGGYDERDRWGPPPRERSPPGRAGGGRDLHARLEIAVFKTEGRRGQFRTPTTEPPPLIPADAPPPALAIKRQRSLSPTVTRDSERPPTSGGRSLADRLSSETTPRADSAGVKVDERAKVHGDSAGDLAHRLSVKGSAAPRRDDRPDKRPPRSLDIKGAGARAPPPRGNVPEPIEPGKPWGRQTKKENIDAPQQQRADTPNSASLLSRLGGLDRPPHEQRRSGEGRDRDERGEGRRGEGEREPAAKRWAGEERERERAEGGRRPQRQWGK